MKSVLVSGSELEFSIFHGLGENLEPVESPPPPPHAATDPQGQPTAQSSNQDYRHWHTDTQNQGPVCRGYSKRLHYKG